MKHSSLFRGSIGPTLFVGVLPFAARAAAWRGHLPLAIECDSKASG